MTELIHSAQSEPSLVPNPNKCDLPSRGDSQLAHQLGRHRAGWHGNVALLKSRDKGSMLQLEVQALGKREVRYTLGITEEVASP